jgi:hypothetical protein
MVPSWGLGLPGFGCDIILCIEVLTLDLGLPVIRDIVIFVVAAFTATRGF